MSRTRTPVHFRLDFRDHLDWAARLSANPRTYDFNPLKEWVAGGYTSNIVEQTILALCDEQHLRGVEYEYDVEPMHRLFYHLCHDAVECVPNTYKTMERHQGDMAEAWLAALDYEPNPPLPLEYYAALEMFCNYWVRGYLPKSRLEPMLIPSLYSVPKPSLLSIEALGKAGLLQLFHSYPGICVNPLLLGRIATLKAEASDRLSLFTFGFMLPILRAAEPDMEKVREKAKQIAGLAAHDAFTPRAFGVMLKLGDFFQSAQETFLKRPPRFPIAGSDSDDVVSTMIGLLPSHCLSDWSFVSWRDGVRFLFLAVFRGLNRHGGGAEVAKQSREGEKVIQKIAFFQRHLEGYNFSSSEALREAREIIADRNNVTLSREVEATCELLQIVASNSDNRY